MIGQNIQKLRKAKGLSQKDLSERLGITKTEISKIEHNTRNVSIDTAIKLSEILDVTLDYLVNMGKTKTSFKMDEKTTKILNYLMQDWEGDFNSMIQLLATYASMPVYMRKDVAEHEIIMFLNGMNECNYDLLEFINISKCEEIVRRLNNGTIKYSQS